MVKQETSKSDKKRKKKKGSVKISSVNAAQQNGFSIPKVFS